MENRKELADRLERNRDIILAGLAQDPHNAIYEGWCPGGDFIRFHLQKAEDLDHVIANLRADTVTPEEAFNLSLVWPKPVE